MLNTFILFTIPQCSICRTLQNRYHDSIPKELICPDDCVTGTLNHFQIHTKLVSDDIQIIIAEMQANW